MTLAWKDDKEVVDLLWADVDVSIDSYVNPNGYSQITVNSGSGQFDAYSWGSPMMRGMMALAEAVGISDFTITGGSGRIHWQSGIVNAQMYITVSAPGFFDIYAKATGNGVADFDNDTITMMARSHAWEIGRGSYADEVPFSRWGLIALAVLLLGTGALIAARRRMAQT
jgi:hypothetical protein